MESSKINKRSLSKWVKEHNFEYIFGSGKMYANDPDTKEWLADIIDSSIRLEMIPYDKIYGTDFEKLYHKEYIIISIYTSNHYGVKLYISYYND